MSERLTLVTSSGLPFLVLAFHVAMGVIGLATGTVAIVARKGGSWHRRSGVVFVYSMVAMALSAVVTALLEGASTVIAGGLTAYLVYTAFTALRSPPRSRSQDITLMLLAFGFAGVQYYLGWLAWQMPGHMNAGVPAGMDFFMATVMLLAGIGDLRMIRDGGVQGTRRIARHLWRMCFGLFIALGSFTAQFIRMPFIPQSMRSLPVILAISTAPLVLLLYWMWKIRLRKSLRGLTLR